MKRKGRNKKRKNRLHRLQMRLQQRIRFFRGIANSRAGRRRKLSMNQKRIPRTSTESPLGLIRLLKDRQGNMVTLCTARGNISGIVTHVENEAVTIRETTGDLIIIPYSKITAIE